MPLGPAASSGAGSSTEYIIRRRRPGPGALAGGPITPLIESFLGYAEYTVLPVSIPGVLTFTSEYSTGLIRTTLVAVPRRGH